MMRKYLDAQFVSFIPDVVEEGVLYISDQYRVAVHKCCCGCGQEVVTPLSPVDWRIRRDRGGTVTLTPSIGNWNFPCKSHYWITRNEVKWAPSMSPEQIRRVQIRDRRDKESYIARLNARHNREQIGAKSTPSHWWTKLKDWWQRRRGRLDSGLH